MKKKLVVVLAATMLATTLFGCGKDTSATTTNETTVSSSTESVEDTNASTSNDSGTLGDALGIENTESTETTTSTNVTWAGNEYIDSYGWKFPSNEYGTTGYTNKYVVDENISDCVTHIECEKGTIDFVWSGPIKLGENASPSNKGVWLYDSNDNYELEVWYGGDIDDDKFNKDLAFDQETWVSFNKTIPYVENGYYDILTSDNIIEVVFEIANDEYKGYAYYVVNKEIGACYQFNYVEKVSIYDDARAKSVIDSIDFAANVIDGYESIDISSITQ